MRQLPVYMRIDKLAIVSAATIKENEGRLAESLCCLEGDDVYSVRPNIKGSDRYQKKVNIYPRELPGACLSIEYHPINKSSGYIRLELSPQNFGPEGITQLISWLADKQRLGNRIYRILYRAYVTRVDCAIDLVGHSLRDYILALKGARKGKLYDSDDCMPGMKLGAVRSSLCIANYDKCYVNGKVPPPDTDGLVTLDAVDFERFTRIEARIKPDSRTCRLSDLQFMDNPLKRLHFYNRELVSDSRLPEEFALALQKVTVPEAWGYLSGTDKERRNTRARIERVFKEYEVPFVDVEAIWEHWCESVEQLGVLAQPLKWDRKIPRRRII